MTIGMPTMSVVDHRTGDISPFLIRDSVRKRVCGYCVNCASVHFTTSDISKATKIFETGIVGLHPFPEENDHGRINDQSRMGHVTHLSFNLYG